MFETKVKNSALSRFTVLEGILAIQLLDIINLIIILYIYINFFLNIYIFTYYICIMCNSILNNYIINKKSESQM